MPFADKLADRGKCHTAAEPYVTGNVTSAAKAVTALRIGLLLVLLLLPLLLLLLLFTADLSGEVDVVESPYCCTASLSHYLARGSRT